MSPRSVSGLEFNVSIFRDLYDDAIEIQTRDDSVEFRESNSAIWGQEVPFRRQLDMLRDATVVLVLSAFTSWERDEGMISSDRRRIRGGDRFQFPTRATIRLDLCPRWPPWTNCRLKYERKKENSKCKLNLLGFSETF